ncbi:MAG: alpha/beta fold hydrolase [Acidobacteria bacterium]|nr:alpha/beta fold hydrolase [Acidobacteriota bacterium]
MLPAVLLSGCVRLRSGPRPKPPALPKPLEIFYVTDRGHAAIDAKKCEPVNARDQVLAYGKQPAAEGRLSFGIYEVVVGEGLDIGSVPQGLRHEVECKQPVEKKKAKRPLRVARPSPMLEGEYFDALAARVNASPGHEMLFFIHGFNYTLAEAAERAGQLQHDLAFAGPVVIYSWPSQENPRKYREDEDSLEASVGTLAGVLQEQHRRAQPERIHVIAHSLGARGLTKAVLRLSAGDPPPLLRFGQVILAAPDMDREALRERAPALAKLSQRITLYVSTVDRALLFGRRFHEQDAPRAGESGEGVVVAPEMDTVDVTAVSESFIGHTYFGVSRPVLADIYQLLHNNTPPEKRFGLFRVESSRGNYWAFRK